jgi:cytochrome P450
MNTNSGAIDLTDTVFWSSPNCPREVDAMRRAAPVQRTYTAEEGAIWSVLSFEQASEVLSDVSRFSSRLGSLLGSGQGQTPAGSGKMMALTDPPQHRELRGPVATALAPRAVASLAEGISLAATRAVETALDREVVDLVDLVAPVPLAVLCELLDIPDDERGAVAQMCDSAFLGTSADQRRAGHRRLLPYLFGKVIERRARPGDDLVSRLASVSGAKVRPPEDVALNLDNVIVGGVQTVRHTAAMSLLALMRDPGSWSALRRHEVSIETAVDELLRWTSVGLHVLRTATTRTRLANASIEADDRVVVWTWAANRDPDAFDRPHCLMLNRSPNRHLALGYGNHYCVGAALARSELAAILTAVIDRVDHVEPLAEPIFNRSIINFGIERLPIRLHRRRLTPARG